MSWIYGLNTFRLFAIVLILIYHFNARFLPGGFIAVELFFALSAFLLFRSLFAKSRSLNSLDYAKLIRGRILRLGLPLWGFMLIFSLLFVLPRLDFFQDYPARLLSATGFAANFYTLLSGASYESFSHPNIWNHCWFLALELQFLLFACVALFLLQSKKMTRKELIGRIAKFFLASGLVSFVLMLLYGAFLQAYDRAYLMLDSHMLALSLGAALACFDALHPRPPRTHKFWPAFALTLASVTILMLASCVEFHSSLCYYFALPFTALLAPIMIYCVILLQPNMSSSLRIVSSHSAFVAMLMKFGRGCFAVLEYLGSLSFYLYLYHYPIYIYLSIFSDGQRSLWQNIALASLISFVLALVSDGIQRLLAKIIATSKKPKRAQRWPALLTSVIFVTALIAVAIFCSFAAPSLQEDEQQLAQVPALEETSVDELSGAGERLLGTMLGAGLRDDLPDSIMSDDFNRLSPDWSNEAVLLIGDSVMLGAKADIQQYLAAAVVDAQESRGFERALPLLTQYRAAGALPSYVVLSLGTNERYPSLADYEALLDVLGSDRTLVVMTAYAGPLQPRDSQNATIREFTAKHNGVYLADWYQIAAHDWSLLYADRIHLNPQGRKVYARLITNTLEAIK